MPATSHLARGDSSSVSVRWPSDLRRLYMHAEKSALYWLSGFVSCDHEGPSQRFTLGTKVPRSSREQRERNHKVQWGEGTKDVVGKYLGGNRTDELVKQDCG